MAPQPKQAADVIQDPLATVGTERPQRLVDGGNRGKFSLGAVVLRLDL
jgi:hypothetical protein